MTDVVAEVGIAQFILERGGMVLLQFGPDPCQHLGALRVGRLLLLFLGRHLPEVELLLHLVENVKPGLEGKFPEHIQLHVSLLFPLIVTRVAVVFQKLFTSGSSRRQAKQHSNKNAARAQRRFQKARKSGLLVEHRHRYLRYATYSQNAHLTLSYLRSYFADSRQKQTKSIFPVTFRSKETYGVERPQLH